MLLGASAQKALKLVPCLEVNALLHCGDHVIEPVFERKIIDRVFRNSFELFQGAQDGARGVGSEGVFQLQKIEVVEASRLNPHERLFPTLSECAVGEIISLL
jgi:hypothetical protein